MDPGFTHTIEFFLGVAVLSAIATGVATFVARRLRLLSHPVERSSHKVPTPQVGGIGIGVSSIAALVVVASDFLGQQAYGLFGFQIHMPVYPLVLNPRWVLICCMALGMILGLVDDMTHMSALRKMAGLLLVAAIPFVIEIGFSLTQAPGAGIERHSAQFWIACGIAFLWILFFANAFNFMDGVNGQSGVFVLNAIGWWIAILFLFHGSELSVSGPQREILLILFALGGGVLGFLPWNFPRAATFMGDSGSLPLGMSLAFLVIVLSGFDLSHAIVYSLPLSLFVYDVVYTLIRRLARRENLLQAHRSHLYQRLLIATGWSHTRLLVFHLPFYVLTGAAAWFYYALTVGLGDTGSIATLVGVSDRTIWWGAIVFVALLLAIYTQIVLSAEKRSRKDANS